MVVVVCALSLTILGIPQEKKQALSDLEIGKITQQLQLLIDCGNVGDWESYTQYLFLHFSDYKPQFIAQRQKYYPSGFRHKITSFKFTKMIKDKTGTWPADWVISFTLTVEHPSEEKIYSAYFYTSQRDGKWYFVEPSIDGCISGCNGYPVDFMRL
ncbi:MAG: hypothetical protein HY819_06530 [Acidobacteria bacterium]|nr:hypothetical protein [Acidobacteriota bacterium]